MNRRQFAVSLAAAPVLFAAAREPSRVAVVSKDEPGQPLIVAGKVFGPDGRTPASGVRLFIYHTGADGRYAHPVDDPRRARLRASMRTGADGAYEFRTIKPGHYPNFQQASHIHVHIAAPNLPDHWIDSFLFAGDPYLDKRASPGPFSPVMDVKLSAGVVLQCERNIRIDAAIAQRNALVNGWYRQ